MTRTLTEVSDPRTGITIIYLNESLPLISELVTIREMTESKYKEPKINWKYFGMTSEAVACIRTLHNLKNKKRMENVERKV